MMFELHLEWQELLTRKRDFAHSWQRDCQNLYRVIPDVAAFEIPALTRAHPIACRRWIELHLRARRSSGVPGLPFCVGAASFGVDTLTEIGLPGGRP